MHAAGQPRLDRIPAGGAPRPERARAVPRGIEQIERAERRRESIELGQEWPIGVVAHHAAIDPRQPGDLGRRARAVADLGELDERLLAFAADRVAKALRERLGRHDRRVRAAGDERVVVAERSGERVGGLDVQRLEVQPDEIRCEGADPRGDLAVIVSVRTAPRRRAARPRGRPRAATPRDDRTTAAACAPAPATAD